MKHRFTWIQRTLLCVLLGASAADAATIYVSPNGDDKAAGTSPETAMASLSSAAARLEPGDTLIAAEGTYYGPIDVSIKGTPEKPIVIRAASRKKNAVILTNADRNLREHKVAWTLEDQALGLYSIPFNHMPARVLYSGTDLQPYLAVNHLKRFADDNDYPGAAHGYAYDPAAKKLFVRLHASGKYGPTDPNQHVMAAAPETGGGSGGVRYNQPTFYNLGILAAGDAHVIVDGFTFETPGCAGVFVKGNHVTVRNAWFMGCRAGVSGRSESEDANRTSNYVTVEYCDFSQFPTFDDMIEVITTRQAPPSKDPAVKPFPIYWWSRKGNFIFNLTYEMGLTNQTGHYWVARNNYIHDGFEGFSSWVINRAAHMEIHHNVFERLVDNAVETENHATDMNVHHNVIRDVSEPISWQPLDGTPWPGPAYFHHNIISNSPELNATLSKGGWVPGLFKAGASKRNWEPAHMKDVLMDSVESPGDGFRIYNNTMYFPNGEFFTRPAPPERRFRNFHVYNNIFVGNRFYRESSYDGGDINYAGNLWANDAGTADEQAGIFTAHGGKILPSIDALKLKAPARGDFTPAPESPAFSQVGGDSAPAPHHFPYIGAIAPGDTYAAPKVGPQPDDAP